MASQGNTKQSLALKAGEATVAAKLVLETIEVLVAALDGQDTVRDDQTKSWQIAGHSADHSVVIYIHSVQLRLTVRRMLREAGITTKLYRDSFLRIDLPVDEPEAPTLHIV